MLGFIALLVVLVLAYQLRRVRRELESTREEVALLGRRLERLRGSPDRVAANAPARGAGGMERAAAAEPFDLVTDLAGAAPASAAKTTGEPVRSTHRRESPRDAAGAAVPDAAVAGAYRVAGAAVPREREPAGADLETRLGTTWTLRIGLGALTVAAGLFARTIVPNLSPALKVVLAYAGAIALVAVGRVFEERLARFGRPVMAGGLAIGFFVSYASYFIPAMRAVPLVVALVWMAAGVIAILALAARWRSEPTAGLAILLGHLSAYVAAGDADSYSLVVILFLSVAAVVLLWRHDWLPLSLAAVVAAYVSHLLWGIADRPGSPPERAMLLSLLFLSSYYAVFLAADLLWWQRRRAGGGGGDVEPVRAALGRSLGPVNVVLYASTAAFLYFAAGQPGSLTTYLFAVGIVQLVLTGAYVRLRNPDWALYPALGIVLITTGFASALDALSLDVVLAAEALLLLVAAQRTGLRVFHLLAQAVLVANFGHYLVVSPGPAALPLFAGGVLIALAYFTQATLEERWYAAGGWHAGAAPAGLAGALATRFDVGFRELAPYFAHAHAAGGALVLARESIRFLGAGAATALLLAVAGALAVAAVVRRSSPLLIGYAITHAGVTAAALGAPGEWGWRFLAVSAASLLLPLALLAGARRTLSGGQLIGAALIGHATAATALLVLPAAAPTDGVALYLGTIAVAALVFLYADRARPLYGGARAAVAALARGFAAVAGVAAVAVIVDATSELVGPGLTAQRGAWLTTWSAVLLGTAVWRRDAGFYLAGFTLLVIGAFHGWLGAASGAVELLLLIAAVPLALAAAQDYGAAGRLPGVAGQARLTTVTSALAYVLGTAVLWTLFVARIGEPWYLLAVAGVALGIHLANVRATSPSGRDFAILLMFVTLFVELTSVIDPLTVGAPALLVCALLVAAAALLLERLVALSAPGAELFPPRYTATALVGAATLVALVALDSSAWRGGAFATVGYSITGAALMTLGFVTRSARHRRIALAVFALTLARVFIVDTRGLSDGGRTIALLVLGLSLVAVAWLYSRFAARIREWL